MVETPGFLAIDLGAASGRAMLGQIGERLTLKEIHRFPNGGIRIGQSLHWDILRLWQEIQNSLSLASRQTSLLGIAVDTWGVDFGLLDGADHLLGMPYHYRDSRTDGMMAESFKRVPGCEIYRQTGIQTLQFNTLFQLFAMRSANDPQLSAARTLLNTPDLINFWLTGQKNSEFTIASTTQCMNVAQKDWARDLLHQLELPANIFQPIIQPATAIGVVRPQVRQETSCAAIPVFAVGAHDTASAVAAIPADDDDFVYISSGTWSLVGVETDQVIVNRASLEYGFTNEGGVGGTVRFLKNLMGMWLLQECRREWANHGSEYSYDDLTRLAAQTHPFQSFIDVGDTIFLPPGEMIERIQRYCRESGQTVPQSVGEIACCILQSLACEYRWTIEKLRELTGKSLPVIHIIGGGSQNHLLNQFTADVTNSPVKAGPVETTSAGNILTQAMALGYFASIAEGRALVRRSFAVTQFQPGERSGWDEAYTRYLQICGRKMFES